MRGFTPDGSPVSSATWRERYIPSGPLLSTGPGAAAPSAPTVALLMASFKNSLIKQANMANFRREAVYRCASDGDHLCLPPQLDEEEGAINGKDKDQPNQTRTKCQSQNRSMTRRTSDISCDILQVREKEMGNEQVFGQVLRDCRSEVLMDPRRELDGGRMKVGRKVMENKRLRALGDGELREEILTET
eukprot:superscaffoldBa00000073_g1132